MNSIGSMWSKWDLHIHTPASFHWSGKQLLHQSPSEKIETCKAIFEKLNELEIDAFCTMDYWTFDGYLALLDFRRGNPSISKKTIFPGLELRLQAPTNYRLNAHVLLSDAVLPETLGQFLAHLKIGSPDGKPPSKQNFIDLARSYDKGKLRIHGLKPEDRDDEEKMCKLGMQTAEISQESLKKAMDLVGKDKVLLILPYDTNDGFEKLDWKKHPFADSTIMKWADAFETRSKTNVDLFLGVGLAGKEGVAQEFIDNIGGVPKPVFSGSDAHKISDYGKYPEGKITWLKAQPTFDGLKQVCYEPSLRCHIGKCPPKLEHTRQNPTKYIDRVRIKRSGDHEFSEKWFENIDLPINTGLVAIIGNKGSGKSALADIIALCGNAHCNEMEFLNANRFRGAGNRAQYFIAEILWKDGSVSTAHLDQDYDAREPERVRYLPQQFIENLCNAIASGKETAFEQELKKVIFSHVPEEERLEKQSLDALLEFTVGTQRHSITQFQNQLSSINQKIVELENWVSADNIIALEKSVNLKEQELFAHEQLKPTVVAEPASDPSDRESQGQIASLKEKQEQLERLEASLANAKILKSELLTKQALITRLQGHIENFQQGYSTFIEQTSIDFENASLSGTEIVQLVVNDEPLKTSLLATSVQLQEVELELVGNDEFYSLPEEIESLRKEVIEIQTELKTPEQNYQTYLSELKLWETQRAEIVGNSDRPDTLAYFQSLVERSRNELPRTLAALKLQRQDFSNKIHTSLVSMQAAHRAVYQPVQQIATNTKFANESLQLEFDTSISARQFHERFLDFIHKGRKGNFYGEEESRQLVQELVTKHNFNITEEVEDFLKKILEALTIVERSGRPEHVSIASQLRPGKRVQDLYDFVFGLSYLESRYTLRLSDKDISLLSPGEKGALLLVFYLLLEKEDIPIIIDQPEQNLDNESVVSLLVDCIREASLRRQVVIVTHNPNLAVVCDADQLICSKIEKSNANLITYSAGAIEDHTINETAVNVLEGTYKAFNNRKQKYRVPPES